MTNPTTNKPDAIYQILYDSHLCTAKYGSGKLCETCEQLVQHALAAIYKEIEANNAVMQSDLAWALGKLRGLGHPAEHLEKKYGLTNPEEAQK